MHGDEEELKAAGEIAEDEQHVAAVTERLRQRLRRRFALRACRRGEPGARGGAASASDSGSIVSRITAKISSVFCQPNWSISAMASGENRNWPNDPAAVPAPKADGAPLGRQELGECADHQRERAAAEAETDQHAGRQVEFKRRLSRNAIQTMPAT